ncbi:MAG: hypothetical protein AAGB26_10030 [Planctomycetota bacterium]
MTIQLSQDGKVISPDESGEYLLKRAPFAIMDTRSFGGIKHFLGAHFTTDRARCESLMQKQTEGHAIGVLEGSGAAWDERVLLLYDEALDTLPAEFDALKTYFGSYEDTISTIVTETTLGNTAPGVVCFLPRYPVHYNLTPKDTTTRERIIFGFSEEGRYPAGQANLLLTLYRYEEPVRFVRQVNVTHFRLQFESD